MIRRPIPRLNGGLNLYPPYQEDIENYAFSDEEMHLDRDFHSAPRDKRQQSGLMSRIHGEFIGELPRTSEGYDGPHDEPNTGGDSFQRSSSNNVEGWGKLRAVPARKGQRSPRIAKITPKDGYTHYSTNVHDPVSQAKWFSC